MGRRKNLLLWVVEVNVHAECASPLLTREASISEILCANDGG
jgi:hypothetical protein